MLLPLAVLLREGFWLRRMIVAISTLELLAFTFIGQAEILNYVVPVAIPFLYLAWQDWRTIKTNAAGRCAVERSQPVFLTQNRIEL